MNINNMYKSFNGIPRGPKLEVDPKKEALNLTNSNKEDIIQKKFPKKKFFDRLKKIPKLLAFLTLLNSGHNKIVNTNVNSTDRKDELMTTAEVITEKKDSSVMVLNNEKIIVDGEFSGFQSSIFSETEDPIIIDMNLINNQDTLGVVTGNIINENLQSTQNKEVKYEISEIQKINKLEEIVENKEEGSSPENAFTGIEIQKDLSLVLESIIDGMEKGKPNAITKLKKRIIFNQILDKIKIIDKELHYFGEKYDNELSYNDKVLEEILHKENIDNKNRKILKPIVLFMNRLHESGKGKELQDVGLINYFIPNSLKQDLLFGKLANFDDNNRNDAGTFQSLFESMHAKQPDIYRTKNDVVLADRIYEIVDDIKGVLIFVKIFKPDKEGKIVIPKEMSDFIKPVIQKKPEIVKLISDFGNKYGIF